MDKLIMYDMELLEYLFKLLTSQTDINYYVLKNLELNKDLANLKKEFKDKKVDLINHRLLYDKKKFEALLKTLEEKFKQTNKLMTKAINDNLENQNLSEKEFALIHDKVKKLKNACQIDMYSLDPNTGLLKEECVLYNEVISSILINAPEIKDEFDKERRKLSKDAIKSKEELIKQIQNSSHIILGLPDKDNEGICVCDSKKEELGTIKYVDKPGKEKNSLISYTKPSSWESIFEYLLISDIAVVPNNIIGDSEDILKLSQEVNTYTRMIQGKSYKQELLNSLYKRFPEIEIAENKLATTLSIPKMKKIREYIELAKEYIYYVCLHDLLSLVSNMLVAPEFSNIKDLVDNKIENIDSIMQKLENDNIESLDNYLNNIKSKKKENDIRIKVKYVDSKKRKEKKK